MLARRGGIALRRLTLIAVIVFLGSWHGEIALAAGPESGTVEALVRANPLTVALSVPEGPLRRGQKFEISLSVRNLAPYRLRDLELTLHVGQGPCLKVSGPGTHRRGVLQGEAVVSRSWQVRVIRTEGACEGVVVMASASAVEVATGEILTIDSEARVLTID